MTQDKDGQAPEIDLEAMALEYGADPIQPPAAPAPPAEPTPTPAPVVDPAELARDFKTLQDGYAEREGQYKQIIDQQNARMSTLENLVNQGFQQAHAEPPKPEIPTFTQEELLHDPVGTIEKVSDAKAEARVQANNQQLSGVIGGLVERSWQAELQALSGKKFYTQVKDEINAMVSKNPALKLQPNSAELAYNMIVGRDLDKLLEGEQSTNPTPPAPPTPPSTPRTPVPVPTGGAPASPVPPTETTPTKEIELTAAQKRLQAKFKALGIDLSDSDMEGD